MSKITEIDKKILQLIDQRKKMGEEWENAIIHAQETHNIYNFSPDSFENMKTEEIETIVQLLNNICSKKYHQKLGYLSPIWSFSYQAGISYFENTVEYTPLNNIKSIFECVKENRVDMGIIPIENSHSGGVLESIYLLCNGGIEIMGEIYIDIDFCLCSFAKKNTDIQEIYSKDMAISQCSNFLNNFFKKITYTYVNSTSEAADIIYQNPKKGFAAICAQITAEQYKIPIIEKKIQNDKYNKTRFLIISAKNKTQSFFNKNDKKRNYKTSIILNLPQDKPGNLAEFLLSFKEKNINLTKIDSRPSREKRKGFKYIFLIDFIGHYLDEPVKEMLEEYKKEITFLGSYINAFDT